MRPSVDVAHRHRDRAAGVAHARAAREAVGGVHGHRADALVAQVLLHLEHEAVVVLVVVELHLEGVVDLGQMARERDLHHHALDLLDGPDALLLGVAALLLLGFGSGFQIRLLTA